jgi:hypothetical protein
MAEQTKQIPITALTFAADLEMGDNGEGAKTIPIKVKARGAQAVDHWFFGRIVHDLAGMSLSKPRLAIDYCHREDEVMGFANKFETEGGLVASGALTPFQEKDRASEVIFKSQQGVPYEASIFFDPAELILEEVPQGMSVPVNGLQFQGPGVVARKWTLRGLAVCPYGQDKNTAVEFSAGQHPKEVAVRYTQTEQPRAEEAAPATVEPAKANDTVSETAAQEEAVQAVDPQAQDPAKKPDEKSEPEQAESPAEGQPAPAAVPVEAGALSATQDGPSFLAAFGDQGGVWFAQGKSFAQCQVLFNQQIQADRDRLTKENEQLRTQLSASRGEREPVSFGGDADMAVLNEPTAKQKAALGSGLARFAANIHLPKSKTK